MPKVNQVQGKSAPLYGATVETDAKTMRERLVDLFQPQDYVRVFNPDDNQYTWQYMPQHAERILADETGKQRMRYLDEPEVWAINAGESEVILGESAYVMIEGLYKKLQAKRLAKDDDEETDGKVNFNFSDGVAQKYWIDKIYRGIERPTFGASTNANTGETKAAKKV